VEHRAPDPQVLGRPDDRGGGAFAADVDADEDALGRVDRDRWVGAGLPRADLKAPDSDAGRLCQAPCSTS
jgi:hypothetical protein